MSTPRAPSSVGPGIRIFNQKIVLAGGRTSLDMSASRGRSRRAVLLAVGGAALLLVLCLMWALSRGGDPDVEHGLLIDNQTDKELLVYVNVPAPAGYLGAEVVLVAHIAPHSRQSSGVVCAAGEMVIRLNDRTEIARRAPDACDDDVPWVIPRFAVETTSVAP